MCGICGIFSSKRLISNHIVSMNESLRHRGPDDEGYLIYDFENLSNLVSKDSKIDGNSIMGKEGNLFLGHRRLSIIDLSVNGHQPMSDLSGKIWVVFNGEIYNYVELRESLEKEGFRFRTNTDTEVIINSYIKWGYECVKYFDGMWAFVIFDSNKDILWGSRDRFGVKPLYFLHNSDLFIFASEIKAIVKSGLYKVNFNRQVISDYLVFGYEEQLGLSFFENIYTLPPSYNFEFNLKDRQLKLWRYYELQLNRDYERFNREKFLRYVQEVRQLIFDTIRLRLRSDVPIGTCLSGGLDSSSIVCVINEIIKNDFIENIGDRQKVFTAVFKNEDIDESKWAEIVVKKTNTEWFTVSPTFQELLNDMEDLVYFQDIPFGSTSIYAQYRVMKLASENNVKVLLDGQGGDEVFTGYVLYYPVHFREIVKNLDLLKLINELKYLSNYPFSRKEIFKIITKSIKLKKLLIKFFGRPYGDKLSIIEDSFVFSDDVFYSIANKIKKYLTSPDELLNDFLYKQLRYGLINLLRYEDRNSMRFSIESRTPFSDGIKLIEYLYSLPGTYKIHNGLSKYILRESLRDILPQEIYRRKDKIGFQTPEKKWFLDNKDSILQMLDNDFLRDFIDLDSVYRSYEGLNSVFIWRVVNLSIWKAVFSK